MTTEPSVEYTASLRIMGSDLDFAFLESSLGIAPDESHRRGDYPTRSSRAGSRIAPFREDRWALRSQAREEEPLDAHIESLIARLDLTLDIVKQIESRGWRIDIFAGVFGEGGNTGFDLSSATLECLGERGIRLRVDVYC